MTEEMDEILGEETEELAPDASVENPNADLYAAEGLHEDEAEEPEEIVPEELEPVQIQSVIESLLLSSEKPLTLAAIKEVFKGTKVKTDHIRKALAELTLDYAGAERGMSLDEVGGGYQLRTKQENAPFVRRMMKGRPFKLSGPALEVLAIIAYKQPIVKAEIDEIRGVESGHLVRALMDRGLVRFDGKSELPGKPMQYATTRKFLEIFGLKDLRELPTLEEIDQLLPEGIGEEPTEEKETLSQMHETALTYVPDQGREEEWNKITDDIAKIATTTDFFEQEKERQRRERDAARAEGIRFAMQMGDPVEKKDQKWLARYEAKLLEESQQAAGAPSNSPEGTQASDSAAITGGDVDLEEKVEAAETAGEDLAAGVESEEAVAEETYPIDPVAQDAADSEALASEQSDEKSDAPAQASEKMTMVEYQAHRLAQILKNFESDDKEE